MTASFSDFKQFMSSLTIRFNGTYFFLLVNGVEKGPFTIGRNPSSEYWGKVKSMFRIAIEFDPTIKFDIAFWIECHETQFQTARSNNRIFHGSVMDQITIPSNVRRFFQIFSVKILLDNCTRLEREMETTTLRLEGLEQLQKELDAVIKEIIRLRPEMAKCQSEFQKLEASSSLCREQNLMAETKEMIDSLSKKYQDFSEKNRNVSKQRLELLCLRNEQQSLLDLLDRTKVELDRSRNEFFASFEKLYPRTPNVLKSADFSECLKRIESASDPCDDAWKDFRRPDFIWHTQMPVLFGLMMTKMVKTSLSKSRLPKPMPLLSFDGLFGKLPQDMQKLYEPHRFFVINHSFLLILSSKLTTKTCMGRRFSLKIQMRFLMKLTNKMLLRFSIEFKKLNRLSI